MKKCYDTGWTNMSCTHLSRRKVIPHGTAFWHEKSHTYLSRILVILDGPMSCTPLTWRKVTPRSKMSCTEERSWRWCMLLQGILWLPRVHGSVAKMPKWPAAVAQYNAYITKIQTVGTWCHLQKISVCSSVDQWKYKLWRYSTHTWITGLVSFICPVEPMVNCKHCA